MGQLIVITNKFFKGLLDDGWSSQALEARRHFLARSLSNGHSAEITSDSQIAIASDFARLLLLLALIC